MNDLLGVDKLLSRYVKKVLWNGTFEILRVSGFIALFKPYSIH